MTATVVWTRTFSFDELRERWKASKKETRNILADFVRNGWVERVGPDAYVVTELGVEASLDLHDACRVPP